MTENTSLSLPVLNYLQKSKEKLTKSFPKNIDDIKEFNPIRPKVEQEKKSKKPYKN
ncbi:MAG: hypothetical protein R3B45_00020 [Bdellovibrionota bacterium]